MTAHPTNLVPCPVTTSSRLAPIEQRIRSLDFAHFQELPEHERATTHRPQTVVMLTARVDQLKARAPRPRASPATHHPSQTPPATPPQARRTSPTTTRACMGRRTNPRTRQTGDDDATQFDGCSGSGRSRGITAVTQQHRPIAGRTQWSWPHLSPSDSRTRNRGCDKLEYASGAAAPRCGHCGCRIPRYGG